MALILPLSLLATVPVIGADACFANAATQAALNRCVGAELEAAESALSEAGTSYAERLDPEQRELFEAMQLHWRRYRDAACEFETSGVLGGSAYRMVLGQCLAAKTRLRAAELEALDDCQEGDLSCPHRR